MAINSFQDADTKEFMMSGGNGRGRSPQQIPIGRLVRIPGMNHPTPQPGHRLIKLLRLTSKILPTQRHCKIPTLFCQPIQCPKKGWWVFIIIPTLIPEDEGSRRRQCAGFLDHSKGSARQWSYYPDVTCPNRTAVSPKWARP